MTERLEIYGRPLERGVNGETVFFAPISSFEDHPFFRFEPNLYVIMNQGVTYPSEPLVVKRSIFDKDHFIIISGHIRKRIAQALRQEEVSFLIIDETVRPLTSNNEIEIMKKANKNQWTKKQKLDFIFNHFGEELSRENRLGSVHEGKETKEVGVLIERSSLGRIPRGTASRLIAERRNELLKKAKKNALEKIIHSPESVFAFNESARVNQITHLLTQAENLKAIAQTIIGNNKQLSENLLLAKELKLDPQVIIDVENEINSIEEESRSSRIMKQKLLILVQDLLKISVHRKEKEDIDEQIKELKKKSEAKLKIILHHGEEIGEFLGRGTIEQLEILKENEKESYEKIKSIFNVFPSIFEKVENFIPTWNKFLNQIQIAIPKKDNWIRGKGSGILSNTILKEDELAEKFQDNLVQKGNWESPKLKASKKKTSSSTK